MISEWDFGQSVDGITLYRLVLEFPAVPGISPRQDRNCKKTWGMRKDRLWPFGSFLANG
jgi:hypothetical protein